MTQDNKSLSVGKRSEYTDPLADADHLRLVVETMSDGLVIVRSGGTISSMNHMAGRITGYSASACVGRPASYILGDALENRGNFVDPTETTVLCADGKSAPVELSIRTLVTADGSNNIVTLRDIAEIKAAQRLLERQALIIEKSESFAFVLDADSRVDWVNARFERLTGFVLNQLVGSPLKKKLFGTGTDPEQWLAIEDAFDSGTPWQGEILLYKNNGQPFWAQIDVNPMFDQETERWSFVGMGFDITDRKYAEQMQLDFISMVSHDLRTPLTVITGAFEAMTMNPDKRTNEVLEMLADMGTRNCEQLDKLIGDLLDVNKMQTGAFVLRCEMLDMNDVIEAAIAELRPVAHRSQVTLCFSPTSRKAMVYADPLRVNQVLTNLVSNAIKFSPTHSVVTVDLKVIGAEVRVRVTDLGRGIPENFRPMMFKRFSREESVQADGTEGFGLGLSICKRLVEQMNGEISYNSQVGDGSCFYFDLPVTDEPTKPGLSSNLNQIETKLV